LAHVLLDVVLLQRISKLFFREPLAKVQPE
jgi:hypothetical protein